MTPLSMPGTQGLHAPMHHPGDELLVAYAAGSLGEAHSLALATHLALCPRCRHEVARLEALGGALLEEAAPAAVGDDLLARVLAGLDTPQAPPAVGTRPLPANTDLSRAEDGRMALRPLLPQPLRGYVGGDLSSLTWRRVIRGVEEAQVPCGGTGAKVRMLRIKAGMAMPRHTHEGSELTLVLDGGFTDTIGHYLRGDFAETDPSVDHQPVADTDGECICLTVTDAPLRLTGALGRFLNPFIKF